MADYEFTLPWPVTVNHYHQPVKHGRTVRIIKSTKAREYESAAMQAVLNANLYAERLECDVEVFITLNPPTAARYDVDNRIKAVLDGITAAEFWLDDSQVVRLTVQKGQKTQGGNAEVKVNKVTA